MAKDRPALQAELQPGKIGDSREIERRLASVSGDSVVCGEDIQLRVAGRVDNENGPRVGRLTIMAALEKSGRFIPFKIADLGVPPLNLNENAYIRIGG